MLKTNHSSVSSVKTFRFLRGWNSFFFLMDQVSHWVVSSKFHRSPEVETLKEELLFDVSMDTTREGKTPREDKTPREGFSHHLGMGETPKPIFQC